MPRQNKRHVKKFFKEIGIDANVPNDVCDGCAYDNDYRLSFGEPTDQMTEPGEYYYVVFKDDFSGYRAVYLREKAVIESLHKRITFIWWKRIR